jgi:hypothetical protein
MKLNTFLIIVTTTTILRKVYTPNLDYYGFKILKLGM